MFIVIGNRLDKEASVYKATAQNLEQLQVRVKEALVFKQSQIVTIRCFTPPATEQAKPQIEP